MTDTSTDISTQKEEALTDFEDDMSPIEYDGSREPEVDDGFIHSLRILISTKNYNVYLITSWIYGSIAYIQTYFNLYLRALGWDFVLMGAVLSILGVFASIMRLLGGYVGDVANRKNLSVVAILAISIFYLIIGLFIDPLMIIVALFVYQSHEIARSGSSAYILDNTPKKHSGLAMSLFNVGKVFGIGTLLIFGILNMIFGFTNAFRGIFLASSLILFLSSLARAKYLEYEETTTTTQNRWSLKQFLSENRRAASLLLGLAPGLLTIVIIDGISDSFFSFGALIYANEVLSIDISGINMILLVYSILSVPLLLKIGRVSDKSGIRQAALIVYSLMPVSAVLLMLGSLIPLWGPQIWVSSANNIYSGLGVIFSTAFIAIVIKYLNDVLWAMVLLTLIQKSLPRKDTAKILAIFWFIVYICQSMGPFLAGVIFEYFNPIMLFGFMLVLNIVILVAIKIGPFAKENSRTDADRELLVE